MEDGYRNVLCICWFFHRICGVLKQLEVYRQIFIDRLVLELYMGPVYALLLIVMLLMLLVFLSAGRTVVRITPHIYFH